MLLFENRTTDGDSSVFSRANRGELGLTDEYILNVYGTWDGASVTAHYSFDNTNWSATDTDATWSQNKGIKVSLNDDMYLKFILVDAGASTSINAEILNVREDK